MVDLRPRLVEIVGSPHTLLRPCAMGGPEVVAEAEEHSCMYPLPSPLMTGVDVGVCALSESVWHAQNVPRQAQEEMMVVIRGGKGAEALCPS